MAFLCSEGNTRIYLSCSEVDNRPWSSSHVRLWLYCIYSLSRDGDMAGFGQDYWIQVVYTDGREDWIAVNGGRDRARDAAALWLVQDGVDFTLVLDGAVRPGQVPKRRQILDEFNRVDDARAEDCQMYRLVTKKAKRVLQ